MVGQGSPMTMVNAQLGRRSAKLRAFLRAIVRGLSAAVVCIGCSCSSPAAEQEVRLRFAWGSGGQATQKWVGRISVSGGELSQLQPLGVEADEAASLRLGDGEVIVSPLVRRAFDGFDVTVHATSGASLRIELGSASDPTPKPLEASLSEVTQGEFRRPLDSLGGYIVINRAPGDRLRVRLNRDHLVFNPNENFSFLVEPDLPGDSPKAGLTLDSDLRRADSPAVIWHGSQPLDPQSKRAIPIELSVPAEEGVYRLALAVRRPASFTDRLSPWENHGPLVEREVELVVVDPARRVPRLTDQWQLIEEIDPGTTHWLQKLPQWTQWDLLPGFRTPRPLGNVPPATREGSPFVTLPATAAGDEPAWQAFVLSIREPGQPHAVEIETPAGIRQHISASLVEADAAGRVVRSGASAGGYCDDLLADQASAPEGTRKLRLVFWPRSRSPVLLLANRWPERALQYGKIRVFHGSTTDAAGDAKPAASQRMVAAYISQPRLAEALGGGDLLDSGSGLAVTTWTTALESTKRLAQRLHSAGYNAAIVAVAADGASLAPVEGLGDSPRLDSGVLATTGADPIRKDVLELMLRVFDREGLRLIPALQLAAPLPELEEVRAREAGAGHDVDWVSFDGRNWLQQFTGETPYSPRYNILDPPVQAGAVRVVDRLIARYSRHSALGGVAIQLSGRGYGVLPGLGWGFDDRTVSRFAAATKVTLPDPGASRSQARAELLLRSHIGEWADWRADELTRFYAKLAKRVSSSGADRQLVLCTEDALSGVDPAERVRQAVTGKASVREALIEAGLDVAALTRTPGVLLLRPQRLGPDQSLADRALDREINSAQVLGFGADDVAHCGLLMYSTSQSLGLPSFNTQSPFGADKTMLTIADSSTSLGDGMQRTASTILSAKDFGVLVDGADGPPVVDDQEAAGWRRAFAALPTNGAEIRSEHRQPATMRTYRRGDATVVCLINESPWKVAVDLNVGGDAGTTISEFGSPAADGVALSTADLSWHVELPAYALRVREYHGSNVRINEFKATPPEVAAQALAARVAELEQCVQGLDLERPFAQLQNPDFELRGADGRMLGWQPRIGQAGSVEVDAGQASAGAHSLRLHSEDALGVAAQSQLFSIPATGQLAIRAKVRGAELAAGSRLLAWIEYDAGGVMKRRYLPMGAAGDIGEAWRPCEVNVDDLPMASSGLMRIQFHLAGPGNVWIDDVRLLDLKFQNAQRQDMVKRLLAAQTALAEGKYVDCLRLVDDYWPRFLVENVPVGPTAEVQLASRPEPAATGETPPADKRFSERLRGFIPKTPKILR